jgi:hypothetical protein
LTIRSLSSASDHLTFLKGVGFGREEDLDDIESTGRTAGQVFNGLWRLGSWEE